MSAAGVPARAFLSIGEVLAQLRPAFPDITISKIRFLESEGLIHPERTPSGYRKFSRDDVARLRFVLAQQRDHYLPLRVIKDHLDAIDRGQAQKVSAIDSADFLRAALPLISGGNKFFLGTMEEQRGFDWIVPPDEPVQKTDDKSRPPSAPSLRKKPTP